MNNNKPRILLTGASGLVGDAILHELINENYPSLVLVRDCSSLAIPKNTQSIIMAECNLENITDDVTKKIIDFSPDYIIHSAWIGTENTNRNQPEFIHANLRSCLALLKIAIKARCKNWIGFGSQAEYSSDINTKITEDMPTFPDTAYGIGKLATYHTLQALANSADIHFTWLRLYTCYGKAYKNSYIIPFLIRHMRNNELPVLRTPHAVWDCLHAEDVANAVIKILRTQNLGGVYNLSSGLGVSVGEIAVILAELLQFSETDNLRLQIEAAKDTPTYRIADIRKFSQTFNWIPKIDIRTGLEKCL